MEGKKKKKPLFKKWWFWAIALVVIAGVLGSNGGGIQDAEPNKSIVANKGEQDDKKEVKKDDVKKEEEYINGAVEVELFPGTFSVGNDGDVVPGRYDVSSLDGTGNFFIYESEMPVVNEMLTTKPEESLGVGVTKLQVDLSEKNTIEISGINKVLLSPSDIELKTSLVSGNHLVGRDVEAGTYIATAPSGMGNLFVYSKSKMPVVNEILGKSDVVENMGVEKVKITIKDGEMIVIGGLETVELSNP